MMEGKTMKGFIEGNAVAQLFMPKLVQYFKAGKFPIEKLIKVYDLRILTRALMTHTKALL